ncbi:MAG: alpha/beta hydrolase [Actinobacteria bacterium]|nr:alpha/beta hydrolase [Actinomycetota bacterium]
MIDLRFQRWQGLRFVEFGEPTPDAPSTILIHGLGGSIEQWTLVADFRPADSHVLIPDIPGFGDSVDVIEGFDIDLAARHLVALIRRKGITRCTLVTHSISSILAGSIVRHLENECQSIHLVSGALIRASEIAHQPLLAMKYPRVGSATLVAFAAAAIPFPVHLASTLVRTGLRRQLALGCFVANPKSLDPELLGQVLTHAGSPTTLTVLRTARAIDFRDLLKGIHCPVHLAYGDSDPLITEYDIAMLSEMVDLQEPRVFEACGHWPWIESPRRLAETLWA